MKVDFAIASELEMRRRKRQKKTVSAPKQWDKWLRALFPNHFNRPFAQRHTEFWQWVDSIQPGIRPSPFFAIWGRGGAKSMSAEGAVIKLAAHRIRNYAWYVSSTQDKADQHVDSISAMLESSRTNMYYPEIAERAVNKYGNSKGWRRSRLRTASGFTIDALGLDTGARGGKIGEYRPDLIIIDDVDELSDSFSVTKKKIDSLTKTLLPAGSNDCAILFIQNLITPDSIASRLLDGRADFITDKIISGPYPAIENMEYEQRDGKFIITGGTPTWAGQDLIVAQSQIVTWGFSSFMQEAQHEVDKTGGIWDHIDWQHFAFKDMPDYVRTAVWVDPAVSSTDDSDSMGISAGGIRSDDTIDGLFWWEDITSPEDAIERAIRKAVEIKSLTVGVETDQGGDTWRSVYARSLEALKKKMIGEMTQEQFRSIRWPDFKSVKAGGTNEETGHAYGSKVERNAKMLTHYENGRVRHMLGTHKVIESALRRFPKKPLDVADSWFWTVNDLTKGKISWGNTQGLGRIENFKSKWD